MTELSARLDSTREADKSARVAVQEKQAQIANYGPRRAFKGRTTRPT